MSANAALIYATLEVESLRIGNFAHVYHSGPHSLDAQHTILGDDRVPDVSHSPPMSEGGGHALHGQRSKHRSIKSIPPPLALTLDSVVLLDRITSLQKWRLVGRWYFSDMEDSEMHNWVEKK